MSENTGYQLISADSHVVEPADIFERGLPAKLRERAPKLVATERRATPGSSRTSSRCRSSFDDHGAGVRVDYRAMSRRRSRSTR